MDDNTQLETLVLDAMRLAERAHRTREQGPHHRKAPDGEDRPAYFIHLAEVAWMLQDAGLDSETVAAGFLHDITMRGVEVAYNFYGIEPRTGMGSAPVLAGSLLFYILYTMWWGYAILFLFYGLGMKMKAGAKKEV